MAVLRMQQRLLTREKNSTGLKEVQSVSVKVTKKLGGQVNGFI